MLKGISFYGVKLKELGGPDLTSGDFIARGLFATITNVNWDDERFVAAIKEGLQRRDQLKAKFLDAYKNKNGQDFDGPLPEAATWSADDAASFAEKAVSTGVLITEDEDVRSLRELLIIGLKGIAAYAEHAAILGFRKNEIYDFMMEALDSTTRELSVDEMVALVMKAGEVAVATMALLDEANTSTYGHPEISEVNIGVRGNPAILISGHDLKDMEELLEQTAGTGIDVYTHGEMLPANYYPTLTILTADVLGVEVGHQLHRRHRPRPHLVPGRGIDRRGHGDLHPCAESQRQAGLRGPYLLARLR